MNAKQIAQGENELLSQPLRGIRITSEDVDYQEELDSHWCFAVEIFDRKISTLELNFIIGKIKHTVKRVKKEKWSLMKGIKRLHIVTSWKHVNERKTDCVGWDGIVLEDGDEK